MTRTIFVACGMGVVFGAAASAQTPAPPRTPTVQTPTAQSMTLVGCLKPWDAATMQVGGTTGTSGTSAPAQAYVLVDAEYATAGATTPGTATTGAPQPPSGASPASGGHATYLLKPVAGMNLASWVDQQVQVMGTMMVDPNLRPGSPGVTGTGAMSTPTVTTGGTPTASTGGTPTTSTGGTPTTSTGSTPTTSGQPPRGTGGTGTTGAVAMSQQAGAAAAQSTFNVASIASVAKTCK